MDRFKEFSREFEGRNFNYYDVGKGDLTIFFLHGIASGKVWYKDFVEKFSNKYRTVTPSLPGHNGVGLEGIDSIGDFSKYINDLVRLVGVDRYVIVGHSLGGMITAKYGQMYCDDAGLVGIVPWATPFLMDEAKVRRIRKKLLWAVENMPSSFYTACNRPGILKFSSLMKMKLTDVEQDLMSKFDRNSVIKIMKMFDNVEYDLSFDVPALYLYGDPDELVNLKNCDYVKGNMGRNSEVIVIKDGGHFGTVDGRRVVIDKIRDFVERVGKTSDKG